MRPVPLACFLGWALISAAVSSVSLAAKAPTDPAQIELAHLQGTWNLVSTSAQGQTTKPAKGTQWIISGNRLLLKSGGKTVPQGLIEIDASKTPKAIHLLGQGTPQVFGIYQLKEHKLEVCASPQQQPTVFVAEGSNVVSILEKAKTGHRSWRARLSNH